MLRVANSTPIVDLESMLNSLRVNRAKRFDFPTPESPMRTTLHPSLALHVLPSPYNNEQIQTLEEVVVFVVLAHVSSSSLELKASRPFLKLARETSQTKCL